MPRRCSFPAIIGAAGSHPLSGARDSHTTAESAVLSLGFCRKALPVRKTTLLGCTLLLLSGSVAYAGTNYDEMIRDLIAVFNDMAATVEKAKDAAEAKPKLEESVAKFADLQKKFEEKKPSPEQEAKLK